MRYDFFMRRCEESDIIWGDIFGVTLVSATFCNHSGLCNFENNPPYQKV